MKKASFGGLMAQIRATAEQVNPELKKQDKPVEPQPKTTNKTNKEAA